MPLILGSNAPTGGYEVDNSCRFDDGSSDNLSRTPSTAGNRQVWTWSSWVKRGNLSTTQYFFVGGSNADNATYVRFSSNDKFQIFHFDSNSATNDVQTEQLFRDVSSWYHIVLAVDTTQATASDRVKIYVNGERVTNFTTASYPSLNFNYDINTTGSHRIGSNYNGGGSFFDGYMSEVVLIDGQQLDETSFGEFDEDSGIWKPINVSGLTFGTNGFYLPFENSADLGQDDSGNGNDFTVNNLTSIDQTTDTPTNNFATFNALTKNTSRGTLSNGNLTYAGTDTNWSAIPATIGVSSGKWYAEFKFSSSTGGDLNIGVVDEASLYNVISSGTGASDFYMGKTAGSYGYFNNTGNKVNNGSSVSYGSSWTNGDIVSVALNMDDGEITFYKNGVSQGVAYTGLSGTYFIGLSTYRTGNANYGNPPFTISSGNSDADGYGNFEYAVPSGYYALNTKNLAEYG